MKITCSWCDHLADKSSHFFDTCVNCEVTELREYNKTFGISPEVYQMLEDNNITTDCSSWELARRILSHENAHTIIEVIYK